MAISKKTALKITSQLYKWCINNSISPYELPELLLILNEIPGNKSFHDSMDLLIEFTQSEFPNGI
jgi:hypothetical protein